MIPTWADLKKLKDEGKLADKSILITCDQEGDEAVLGCSPAKELDMLWDNLEVWLTEASFGQVFHLEIVRSYSGKMPEELSGDSEVDTIVETKDGTYLGMRTVITDKFRVVKEKGD